MPKTPYTPSDHAPLIASVLRENDLPGADAARALSDFANRLLTCNQVMNLTAITEPQDVALKHFADSIALSSFLPSLDCRMIDVGTGAGFPSIPLAIVHPSLRIVAMDSTAKRIRFLRESAEVLSLPNLGGMIGRAEEIGTDPDFRERFDVATARAVAELRVLSELCLPLVKVGGRFLAMKSGEVDGECRDSAAAIRKLGGRILGIESYTLRAPGADELLARTVVLIEKIAPTPPIYPRAYAQIVKKPL